MSKTMALIGILLLISLVILGIIDLARHLKKDDE